MSRKVWYYQIATYGTLNKYLLVLILVFFFYHHLTCNIFQSVHKIDIAAYVSSTKILPDSALLQFVDVQDFLDESKQCVIILWID